MRAANHFTCAEHAENDVDLRKLRIWCGKIARPDFCGASPAAVRLRGCEALRDAYARQLVNARDENR